jgi:hypothetical protein
MQDVKFAKEYEHVEPLKTTVYEVGYSGKVSNEVADAARAAGKLEEKAGGSDKTSPKGDADGAKG